MADAYKDEPPVEFAERFAAVMVVGGMPRMPARVFAWLLSRDEASGTAAELAAALQASPAAISGAVRYLIQLRLIVRAHRPGDRKDIYRLRSEHWYEMLGNRDHELQQWSQLSREGQAVVGPDTPAGRRLGETADFFEFLAEEMTALLERWRARTS